MEFDGINFQSMTVHLAQFPYLVFNYVILWPQMQTNIKIISFKICYCLLEFNWCLVILMELPLFWPGPACSPGKHSLRDWHFCLRHWLATSTQGLARVLRLLLLPSSLCRCVTIAQSSCSYILTCAVVLCSSFSNTLLPTTLFYCSCVHYFMKIFYFGLLWWALASCFRLSFLLYLKSIGAQLLGQLQMAGPS